MRDHAISPSPNCGCVKCRPEGLPCAHCGALVAHGDEDWLPVEVRDWQGTLSLSFYEIVCAGCYHRAAIPA